MIPAYPSGKRPVMLSTRIAATAAACYFACASPAFANDKPKELELGDATIRQALASPDGSTVFLLEGSFNAIGRPQARQDGRAARLRLWNAAKKAVDGEIKIPKGAVHMALIKDKLVLACAESEAVVIVDAKTRKIVRTIETETGGQSFPPTYVVPDSPPGKAVVLSKKADAPWWDVTLLELDLSSGAVGVLAKRASEHAVFTKDSLVTQGNFGGSPSGPPEFWKLSQLRKKGSPETDALYRPAGPDGKPLRRWHSSFAPFRAVNDGANLVTTDQTEKTVLFSSDGTKELWQQDGAVFAIHPTKPLLVAIATASNYPSDSKEFMLTGLNTMSGRRVWQRDLTLDRPVNQADLVWGSKYGRTPTILPGVGGAPDQLLFLLPMKGSGRIDFKWFRVELPATEGLPNRPGPSVEGAEPPSEIKVGESFDWTPKTKNLTSGTRFILKQSPDGMNVSAETGRLTWRPDATQIGKHDVELAARVGEDEFALTSFSVRVRAKP